VGSNYEGVTGLIAFDKDAQRSAQPYLKLKNVDGVLVPR
jgi:hypothetical protein